MNPGGIRWPNSMRTRPTWQVDCTGSGQETQKPAARWARWARWEWSAVDHRWRWFQLISMIYSIQFHTYSIHIPYISHTYPVHIPYDPIYIPYDPSHIPISPSITEVKVSAARTRSRAIPRWSSGRTARCRTTTAAGTSTPWNERRNGTSSPWECYGMGDGWLWNAWKLWFLLEKIMIIRLIMIMLDNIIRSINNYLIVMMFVGSSD